MGGSKSGSGSESQFLQGIQGIIKQQEDYNSTQEAQARTDISGLHNPFANAPDVPTKNYFVDPTQTDPFGAPNQAPGIYTPHPPPSGFQGGGGGGNPPGGGSPLPPPPGAGAPTPPPAKPPPRATNPTPTPPTRPVPTRPVVAPPPLTHGGAPAQPLPPGGLNRNPQPIAGGTLPGRDVPPVRP